MTLFPLYYLLQFSGIDPIVGPASADSVIKVHQHKDHSLQNRILEVLIAFSYSTCSIVDKENTGTGLKRDSNSSTAVGSLNY